MKNSRYPSYSDYKPSSPASSNAKRSIRAQNTRPEIRLKRELRRAGVEFHANNKALLGRPDIVFFRVRLAVFCDGDFWHGRDWSKLKRKLETRANAPYWIAKISANRRRDSYVNRELKKMGWHVIRLWEGQIMSDVETAVQTIVRYARSSRRHRRKLVQLTLTVKTKSSAGAISSLTHK